MSFEYLFEDINEELNKNKKKTVSSKKSKDNVIFESIAKEILKEDERQDEGIIGDTVKAAGTAIKSGWQKLKNKIREVALSGFRAGVAIGKTFQNRFVLFNKKGEILSPEMDKIYYSKLKNGKRVLTLEKKIKNVQTPFKFRVSDTINFGYASAIGKNGEGILYIIKPANVPLKEGIDYTLDEAMTPQERKARDANAFDMVDALAFGMLGDKGAEALDKTIDNAITPVEVDYDDFAEEIGSLMNRVKEKEVSENSKIKTLGIYAPTGWGKSQIIEKVAKKYGFLYWPIELAKLNVDAVSGFPYLADVEMEDGERERIVRQAASEILPSPDIDQPVLLFFDEFNRADTEKMAAVMNLMLTGELGGGGRLVKDKEGKEKVKKYHLPENIIVLLAMNTGSQKGAMDSFNAVQNLDVATLERVHRVLFGKYHFGSWVTNFGGKPAVMKLKNGTTFPVLTQVPAILLNYMANVAREKGGVDQEAPFLLPIKVARKEGQEGGGGERTTSPRSWTMVGEDMIERGWQIFKQLSPEQKKAYEPAAKKLKEKILSSPLIDDNEKSKFPQNDEDYLFAAWMNDAENQIILVGQQSAEFGEEGEETVKAIIRSYMKKVKQGVPIETIVFNYKDVRGLVKNYFNDLKFGTYARFMANIYYCISRYKNSQEASDYMSNSKFPMPYGLSPESIVAQTIRKIYEDFKDKFNKEDFIGFAHLMREGSTGEKQNAFVRAVHNKLTGAEFPPYKEALAGQMKTKSQVMRELEAFRGTQSEQPKEAEETNEDLMNFFSNIKGL